MARPDSVSFGEKYRRVQLAVATARSAERQHFDFTADVEPGVRLVLSEAGGVPLVFSLWSRPQDIAELCSDASVPSTAALLALDAGQARDLRASGLIVDLGQLSRSQSRPDVYYTLFDHASPRRIHSVLHRLVPALESHPVAA